MWRGVHKWSRSRAVLCASFLQMCFGLLGKPPRVAQYGESPRMPNQHAFKETRDVKLSLQFYVFEVQGQTCTKSSFIMVPHNNTISKLGNETGNAVSRNIYKAYK